MAISCGYCSGAHDTPAEVRACWADRSGSPVPADVSPADAVPADAVPADVVPVDAVPADVVPADASNRRTSKPVAPRGTGTGASLERAAAPLGRHLVIGAGQSVPAPWRDVARVVVGARELADPAAAVAALRAAANERRSVVVEVADGFDLPPHERTAEPPHRLGPRHEFVLDALHHLVWSNAVDARDPDAPRWALLDAAVALGATAGGPADVVLPDGTPAWLDGGPPRFTAAVDGTPVVHAVSIEHGSLEPPISNDTGAPLAPDQLAAVTHPGGAARIIAPAGSGKTRVLTERARHLVAHWRVPPSAIGLVAFNKRAQEEMRERTADLPGLQVRTLNSIALAVVNGTPPFGPQPTRVGTIDEPDVRRIIGSLVSFPKRRNVDPVAPWIEALGLVRLGLVDPADAEARYDGDVDGLADVWPRYRAALERERVVDFDGQIHGAIEVLLADPGARLAAQRACRYLLVDEFQDLTPAHLLLVRLLAGPSGSVFGVGDDDQTIYGYNGADPGWLIDFATLFPGAGEHPLEVNYRCPAGIVDAADRLLRHNRRRVPKVIRAASDDTGGWSVTTSDDPVGDTVRHVQHAIEAGRAPSEVAVLTRVNALLAPVQVALAGAGVAVSGGVGLEFVDRTSVRAALAWLRLGAATADRSAGNGAGRGSSTSGSFASDDLVEALRRPSRPLHPRIGGWVAEQHDADGLRRLADRLTNERDAARVAEFADDIERVGRLVERNAATSDLIAAIADDIGLAGSVATLDTSRRGMNRSAQGDDLGALRQLARLHDAAQIAGGVAGFERWLRDQLAVRRDPDGVTLATVHRVKGQEWPEVVVHFAEADQYPHRLADDVEEERRLFHVALTRAGERCTVVTGDRPSRFVAELTAEPPDVAPEVPIAGQAPDSRARPGREAARAGRGASAAARDHPLLDRERVVVAPGMVIVDQGAEWTVVHVGTDEFEARSPGGAARRFPFARPIQTRGRQRGVPIAPDEQVGAVAARAYDALRSFRDAARDGKPAYTVFDDKTLAAIATSGPTTLDELARVKGVGPAKLEQFGDAVLAAVADAVDPTPNGGHGDVPSTTTPRPPGAALPE